MHDETAAKHRSLSTSGDESDLLKSLMDRKNSGERKVTTAGSNKVYTREELEEKSNITRAKRVDKRSKDDKPAEVRGKSKSNLSRGILKNGSRRDYSASFKMKEFTEAVTPLEKPEEVEPEGMQTNLEIDCWSVASFDTCSADVRRTYAKQFAIRIGRWFTNARTLAVFKNKQGLTFSVPMHEKSDFEDDEPYGPHDPDSSFYKRKRLERRSNKRKSKMRRIKSLASFSRKGSGPERNKSGGKTLRSRVARISNQFSRESAANSEDVSKNEVKDKIKGALYVPPDMTYDPTYNNGKGGLVNKEPEFLPPNKIWSKAANNGKGGVINKPPQPHTIAPGLIWSRTACNGQGGLVNLRPEVIPEGKMWDYNADDGMGALVDASASYLLRLKEKQQKSRAKKNRKNKGKMKKVKSQGKIRISNSRDELLRELNAENDKIFAEIDAEEERERQALANKEKKRLDTKEFDKDEEGLPPKYLPKDDDGSVVITDETDMKQSSTSSLAQGRGDRRRPSLFSKQRRSSLYSTAKSVISEGVKKITRKSIQLRKSMLLASADKPVNKEKAKKLGIEEGQVAKMYETFERMSLKTSDAVRAFDSDSSSSGSDLL